MCMCVHMLVFVFYTHFSDLLCCIGKWEVCVQCSIRGVQEDSEVQV